VSFAQRRVDASLAALYSQALVGMVALTGQWWLDVRSPGRDEVAAHLVNLGVARALRHRRGDRTDGATGRPAPGRHPG